VLVPTSPVTNDTPVLVSSPLAVNKAKHEMDFKSGAAGPVSAGLPQPTGVKPLMPSVDTAPVVDIARPSSCTPAFITIAALFAITFPFILVPAAISTKPSTFQNTLQALALFSNTTSDNAAVEKAPLILMINSALAFPCPSRYRMLLSEALSAIE